MNGRGALEPYDGKQLFKLLTKTFAGTALSQQGSHVQVRLPNGVEVGCPQPLSGERVTTVNAKAIALSMGRDLRWLREQLGYAQLSSRPSRLKASAVATPSRQETDKVVKDAARELFVLCRAVEGTKASPHDVELRRRIAKELPPVITTLRRLTDLVRALAS